MRKPNELGDRLRVPRRGAHAWSFFGIICVDNGTSFRILFFAMTLLTIGLVSNFRKLREEEAWRLAAVYVVSLFGFIVWIGLAISWGFFTGIRPPIAGG